MTDMTDTSIVQEFEALFGQDTPPVETPPAETPPVEDQSTPPAEDTPPAEEETPPGDDTPPTEDKPPAAPAESKLNFAMAKLRNERNEFEGLLKDLGAQIGLDPKLSPKEIAAQLKDLTIKRTAEKYNIPPELAADVAQTKSIIAEHAQTQRYIQTTQSLDEMKQKYGYSQEVEDALIDQLIAEGRHPLDVTQPPIDLEGEFLKRFVKDIITQQREEAAEAERKKLAEEDKTPQGLPGTNPGGETGGDKINTVEGLDAYFNSLAKE